MQPTLTAERTAAPATGAPILSVRNLKTYFQLDEGVVRAVDGVSFDVHAGRTLGIVGESGCGKSITARSILGIVDRPGRIEGGEILLGRGAGEIDLAKLDPNGPEMRALRGKEIALVFQEPMASFSHYYTVGNQIMELIRLHSDASKAEARNRAIELLRMVGVPRPERRVDEYPFQLSGGLRQRVMIAMALACDPRILIADEPTTALDVTTQAQVLELLQSLQEQRGLAIILITHDMGVIAEMADDVVVMYLGRGVEKGPVDDIFHAPKHPYTRALLRSIPSIMAQPRTKLATISGSIPHPFARPSGCPFHPRCGDRITHLCEVNEPEPLALGPDREVSCFLDRQPAMNLLEVQNLRKFFPIRKGFLRRVVGQVRAVDDVSFSVRKGETLALVGESGCGKTTVSRCIMRALAPTSGAIRFSVDGNAIDVAPLKKSALKPVRRHMQMVFQDPFSSLNPRMMVGDIIGEPLLINGWRDAGVRRKRVRELLDVVQLPSAYMNRFPHAFSGGQRQRIGIARALALNPSLIVADEPVSALDVSVQAQILNLMLDLQDRLNLTYLFVAHDLSVVKHVSDRVAVMYVGRLVEVAPTKELFETPKHPYTEALLSAVPKPDPRAKHERIILQRDVADPANPPPGCYFHPRCRYAVERCKTETPKLEDIAPGHAVACHRARELSLRGVS